jgi:signal-transduction protein with cAMP-binding, CBS, and nucleotidyltransferase domain
MVYFNYSLKVILKDRSSIDTTVAEIMSSDFPIVYPKDNVDYCMQLMSQQNLRHLPVKEYDNLVGILSIHDVITETIITQKETILHLQAYIQSRVSEIFF